jgi:hypothetical protein
LTLADHDNDADPGLPVAQNSEINMSQPAAVATARQPSRRSMLHSAMMDRGLGAETHGAADRR